MVYKHKERIPSKVNETEHHVSNCIKCYSDKIILEEYDDRYGYISNATCSACKNNIKVEAGILKVIEKWNEHNDHDTVIANLKEKRFQLKKEIKKLKALHRKRTN